MLAIVYIATYLIMLAISTWVATEISICIYRMTHITVAKNDTYYKVRTCLVLSLAFYVSYLGYEIINALLSQRPNLVAADPVWGALSCLAFFLIGNNATTMFSLYIANQSKSSTAIVSDTKHERKSIRQHKPA